MLIYFHLTSKESRAQSNLFFKSISAALRCRACSSSLFFFRGCLFSRSCSLWLFVARLANSSPYFLLFSKHPSQTLHTYRFSRAFWGGVFLRTHQNKFHMCIQDMNSPQMSCRLLILPLRPYDRARSTPMPPPPLPCIPAP